MDPDRICMYLLKRLEEESLRCVPFVLIFGVGVMGDSGSPEASFMQNIFNLFTSRYTNSCLFFIVVLNSLFSNRNLSWFVQIQREPDEVLYSPRDVCVPHVLLAAAATRS
jgi:hypothetical protein